MKKLVVALFMLGLGGGISHAEGLASGWSGEGSLSAGVTTGNTDTSDVGLAVDLKKEAGVWTYGLQASADYGKIDGQETKNRIFAGLDADRQLNDRLFAFGRLSHERDEFTGFESRTFVGTGLGYQIYEGDKVNWAVRGGPGLKIDKVREINTVDGTGAPVTIPSETVNSFGVIAASDYSYAFNENVSFTNTTSVLYAKESTQISNSAAITASLTSKLSARMSFDVRHDTDPPVGFEATDTATRVSLVYAF
ncbi:MAG TPA: DUF481 domain-containing protein [Hyphomonas sp.]|nr:DUF481 domain-containing protein [Hyphomonas sp.]MCB9972583.1 DUF481 domain-containing protein [Hyphomonas sp.]HPE46836.1 DUF481 domain-containing protein [Hyphomonas sp.]